ncbi:MAG: methyltransferase domain-containing protein, partial [Ruminococcus sp.]|nr:methyltransferase domain-containing protein [Ruminococcus sp.]
DLANKINIKSPQKILDLGCGTGNSSQVLKDRFPFAEIVGVDNSQTMIEQAEKEHSGIKFMLTDISGDISSLGSDYDIVFSNACIQWIPDHKSLIPKLMGLLKTGGVLAVQAPMQSEHPVQQLIHKLAFSDKWSRKIKNPRPINTLTQDRYFDILSELTSDFSIWKTVYGHRMPSHQKMLNGTKEQDFVHILLSSKKRMLQTSRLNCSKWSVRLILFTQTARYSLNSQEYSSQRSKNN